MVRDERLDEPDAEAVARAAREARGRAVADVTPISKGINAIYRIRFAGGEVAVLKAATFNTTAELRPEPYLLRALADATTLPVPEVLATAEDGGPLGVFHFLLEHREGRQIRDLDGLSWADRERLVRAVGRHLARLHEFRLAEAEGPVAASLDADDCGPLRMTDPEAGATPAFTADGGDSWGEVFASLADHPASLVEQVQCGDDPGRFADLVPDIVAAFDGVADAITEPETPAVLHRDFHLDNFVLGSDEEGGLDVRTVLDFGDPYVGDYRLDLAFAEDATIRVQLPTEDRAADLRHLLRRSYARERGIDPDEIVNGNYPYYLLVQRSRWMSVALDWKSCDDPAAVERAYRSFVRERLAEIE
ncbi:phosphotransferase [Halorussus gelatinilyticus]|uniref:Phosphotransferase n=1 Tax=Halorussus gelatinilyticus TaxID=2937524 RepID=A0A8U0IGL6_9EURY|nr:phosphotransferase [Halorussus gelatinilyticus]UPV99381.1 phosphotransferase [Halorussus gelatinilyticus]